MPSRPKPIVLIGAGGIVNDAHLPAFAMARFKAIGIYDINTERSRQAAEKFDIPRVLASLEEALRTEGAVFDIAVPPDVLRSVLEQMADGATVLMQKPVGTDLAEARRIVEVCRAKRLTAAVNFQLRFSRTLCRYVEANPLRAGLVEQAQDWQWSGLWRRAQGQGSDDSLVLSPWPAECPRNWTARVNAKLGEPQLRNVRECVDRGRPLGSE